MVIERNIYIYIYTISVEDTELKERNKRTTKAISNCRYFFSTRGKTQHVYVLALKSLGAKSFRVTHCRSIFSTANFKTAIFIAIVWGRINFVKVRILRVCDISYSFSVFPFFRNGIILSLFGVILLERRRGAMVNDTLGRTIANSRRWRSDTIWNKLNTMGIMKKKKKTRKLKYILAYTFIGARIIFFDISIPDYNWRCTFFALTKRTFSPVFYYYYCPQTVCRTWVKLSVNHVSERWHSVFFYFVFIILRVDYRVIACVEK